MSSTTEITQAPRRLLRLKQVLDRTGLPKSTMYSRISAGTFPKQVPVGSSVRWLESEVEAWIQALVGERDHRAESGGTAGVSAATVTRHALRRKTLGSASSRAHLHQ